MQIQGALEQLKLTEAKQKRGKIDKDVLTVSKLERKLLAQEELLKSLVSQQRMSMQYSNNMMNFQQQMIQNMQQIALKQVSPFVEKRLESIHKTF